MRLQDPISSPADERRQAGAFDKSRCGGTIENSWLRHNSRPRVPLAERG
jgi:hypothetical protein